MAVMFKKNEFPITVCKNIRLDFRCDLDWIAFIGVVGFLGWKIINEYYISKWGADHPTEEKDPVTEYCKNDVIATEAVWNDLQEETGKSEE